MASLQQELNQKPDALRSDHSSKLGRKRTFSEITDSGPQSKDCSYLTRMYDHFTTRGEGTHRDATMSLMAEQEVMSSRDISLEAFGKHEAVFVHSNYRVRVWSICFSRDGSRIAVGSVDGSVRVFDVAKLHQSSNFNLIKKYDSTSYSALHRPVVCTLNSPDSADQTAPSQSAAATATAPRVFECDFYPQWSACPHLVSCFEGGVHLFEFGPKSRKVPLLTVNESFAVRSVQYHPAGQFVLSGGESSFVRLYDVQKEQGFIARRNERDEVDINQVRWGLHGNVFASCSEGGDIRLYDGRTMDCVNTLRQYHCGRDVTSIRFNTDSKYLLSAGGDDVIRLTDLRMGRQCQQYLQCRNRVEAARPRPLFQAVFSYNDEHVVACSNVANRIFVYDTNSGHRITNFKDHATDSRNTIDYIAASPTEPAFMCSSSSDCMNRFYAPIKRLSADELSSCVEDESPMSARSQNSHTAGSMDANSDPLAPLK